MSTIHLVESITDLALVMIELQDDDVIELAPFDYDKFIIQTGKFFAGKWGVTNARGVHVVSLDQSKANFSTILCDAEGWRFEGMNVTAPSFMKTINKPGQFPIRMLGNGQSLVKVSLDNGDHTKWTAAEWQLLGSNVVQLKASNFLMDSCWFRGIYHGVLPDHSNNNIKIKNTVFDGCGKDVCRVHGANILIDNCLIVDVMSSAPKDHVGGFTTFAEPLPGTHLPNQNGTCENITITNSTFINSRIIGDVRATPSQFAGMQDGQAVNWYVANNLVLSNGYRGFGFPARNCIAENNVVVLNVKGSPPPDDLTAAPATYSQFNLGNTKLGVNPTGNIVKNNYANRFKLENPTQNTYVNNFAVETKDMFPKLESEGSFECVIPNVGCSFQTDYLVYNKMPWEWTGNPTPIPDLTPVDPPEEDIPVDTPPAVDYTYLLVAFADLEDSVVNLKAEIERLTNNG